MYSKLDSDLYFSLAKFCPNLSHLVIPSSTPAIVANYFQNLKNLQTYDASDLSSNCSRLETFHATYQPRLNLNIDKHNKIKHFILEKVISQQIYNLILGMAYALFWMGESQKSQVFCLHDATEFSRIHSTPFASYGK